jgi:hypothetical protein
MAELKHTFLKGKMDKDSDERLVENGAYRDALNIHVSSSEGANAGAIENLLGNEQLSSLQLKNAKVLGSVVYTLKDKLYWIVTSDNIDGIYEYDQIQKEISPILIDTKSAGTKTFFSTIIDSNSDNELILDNISNTDISTIFGNVPNSNNDETLVSNNIDLYCENPYIKISIPKDTVIRKENDLLVFKNIHYSGQAYGGVDLNVDFSLKSVLNFSKSNIITGINIIDDMLFWTDNLNGPRKINISRFKKYTESQKSNNVNIFETQTKVLFDDKDVHGNIFTNTRNFTEDDISLAKKVPMSAPTLSLSNTLTNSGITTIPFLTNFQNNNINVDVGDDLFIPVKTLPIWKVGDTITITAENPTVETIELTATVKLISFIGITLTLTTKDADIDYSLNYEATFTLLEKKPIHELSFVRFGYRWKYNDNEYSSISPFSEVAFIPGDTFKYNAKEGINTSMENQLRIVKLSDFDTGDDNVSEIEILYKESANQNIYTLKSIKRIDFEDTYEITKEQIHSVLPNDQLLRSWDNVPKKAKSQEVTSNRIIFGNYKQNYDIYNPAEFDVFISQRFGKQSIKSNRNYQIGVSYIDEYNRHSPILSNDTGSFFIDKTQATVSNEFNIALKSKPPAWAKYFKYYIKDISSEYYNLAADRFYVDKENGFVYISFSSNERNKVSKDDSILLKKKHGTDEAVSTDNNRFKVIEVFNEAPAFITQRKKAIEILSDIKFSDNISGSNVTPILNINNAPASSLPKKRSRSVKIMQAFKGVDYDSLVLNTTANANEGVPQKYLANLQNGKFVRFISGDKKTDYYKISSVSIDYADSGSSGDNDIQVQLTFDRDFNDDVNVLYDAAGNIGDSNGLGVNLEIAEEFSAAGDKEFDGRFFIKVAANEELLYINNSSNTDYYDLESFDLAGVDRHSDKKKNKRVLPKNDVDDNPKFPLFISNNNPGGDFAFGIVMLNHKQASLDAFEKFDIGTKFYINEDSDNIYEIQSTSTPEKTTFGGYESQRRRRLYSILKKNLKIVRVDTEDIVKTQDLPPLPALGSLSTIKLTIVEENFDNNKIPFSKNPAIFETEPKPNKTDLDIYYETEKAFDISEHGNSLKIKWFNCFNFSNGVESNRIRDDFNSPFIQPGVKASAPITDQIKEEHKFNGIIWSGIINSRSGLNKSNEFNVAYPITKDLLPSYGSIQKLHAWDDRLIMLCEDKIVRAYADKDVIYNADGNMNIVATNKVIGDAQPYAGEYGISTNPESFAAYGFRCYFTDKMRGAVIRLSLDGMEVISNYFMSDFFNDRFFGSECYNSVQDNSYLLGSYDSNNGLYNISFLGRDTVCFDEQINGWVTRKSFIPQNAISLNNIYYTYNNGDIWQNDSSNVPHNNFYNVQYTSKVQLEINDDPSVIKKYRTLGYEGTKGWQANIVTDQEKSSNLYFVEKENKYFAYVKGEEKNYTNLDLKSFNLQGLGNITAFAGLSAAVNTELKFQISPNDTFKYISNPVILTNTPGTKLSPTVSIKIAPKNGYILDANKLNIPKAVVTKSGKDLIVEYTHGIKSHPTEDKTVEIELCKINFAEKENVSITGNYSFSKTGKVSSSIPDDSYNISGNTKTLQITAKRTLIPDPGNEILFDSIKTDNPNVQLTKKQNDDGSVTVTERIQIGTSNITNFDYEISAIAIAATVATKELVLSSINKDDLINQDYNRILSIYGDPGSAFSYELENNGGPIDNINNIVIPDTGIHQIPINFDSSNITDLFTITLTPGQDTVNGANFENIIQIPKTQKSTHEITMFSQFNNTMSNKSVFKATSNDAINYDFSFVLNLPSANYVLKSQVKQKDFIFDNTTDNTELTDLNLVLDNSANTVTLSGNINIDKVTSNNKIILFLTDFVNEQITLQLGYSNVTAAGVTTTNYTFAPSSTYSIIGPSGLAPQTIENEYLFTLTPSGGFEFINNISSNDFEIIDSGNNNVTATYALNNTVDISVINSELVVKMIPNSFNMPPANETINIVPKDQITQSIQPPLSDYSLVYDPLDNEDRLFTDKLILGKLTDSSNQQFLFQKTFVIDRTLTQNSDYTKIFSTLGHVINLLDNELSLATAGTYTDINGNSVAVTDHIELNTNKTELTLNILANINAVPDKAIGTVEFDFATEESYHIIELQEGNCDTHKGKQIVKYRLFNADPLDSSITKGSYIANINDSGIGATDGSAILQNKFKIVGGDKLVILNKSTINGIDKVKGFEQCSKSINTIIDANDITRVYGDPDFQVSATTRSGANLSFVVKSVPLQNVITSTSSGKVTIQNAGTAEIIISAPQVTKGVITYLPATKTIKVTIQKATRTISFDKEIYTTKFGSIIAKVTQSGPVNTPTYEVIGSAGVVGPILPVDPSNPFEVNVFTIGAVGRSTVIKVTAFPGMNFLPAFDTAIVKIEQRDPSTIDSDGDGVADADDDFPHSTEAQFITQFSSFSSIDSDDPNNIITKIPFYGQPATESIEQYSDGGSGYLDITGTGPSNLAAFQYKWEAVVDNNSSWIDLRRTSGQVGLNRATFTTQENNTGFERVGRIITTIFYRGIEVNKITNEIIQAATPKPQPTVTPGTTPAQNTNPNTPQPPNPNALPINSLTPFQMSTRGHAIYKPIPSLAEIAAQSFPIDKTYYHNGTNILPDVGDSIRLENDINGTNPSHDRWYRLTNNSIVRLKFEGGRGRRGTYISEIKTFTLPQASSIGNLVCDNDPAATTANSIRISGSITGSVTNPSLFYQNHDISKGTVIDYQITNLFLAPTGAKIRAMVHFLIRVDDTQYDNHGQAIVCSAIVQTVFPKRAGNDETLLEKNFGNKFGNRFYDISNPGAPLPNPGNYSPLT